MVSGTITANDALGAGYFRIRFYAPEICDTTCPGQFVHVKIARLRDRILRRPFSICDVDTDGRLTVIYKVVGEGTSVLSQLSPGVRCDLMGPLGKPFSLPAADEIPVIVAGGYGSAATYLIARRAAQSGVLLLGARSQQDLILTAEFAAAGFEVMTATEDGSQGVCGRVTELLDPLRERYTGKKLRFYGCGPTGMLMALGQWLLRNNYPDGELSLDHLMCCGVGACFACVVKVKADNADGWRYARTCREGPVFKASEVFYS